MSAISSSERRNFGVSTTSRFSRMRDGRTVRGRGMMLRWANQRSATAAGDTPWRWAMARSVGSSNRFILAPRPSGDHAQTTIPFCWQNSTRSTFAFRGWTSAWLTAGSTSGARAMSCSRCVWVKLATPIESQRPSRRAAMRPRHMSHRFCSPSTASRFPKGPGQWSNTSETGRSRRARASRTACSTPSVASRLASETHGASVHHSPRSLFGCATLVVTKTSGASRRARPSSSSLPYTVAVSKCRKPAASASLTSCLQDSGEVWASSSPTNVPIIDVGMRRPSFNVTVGSMPSAGVSPRGATSRPRRRGATSRLEATMSRAAGADRLRRRRAA
mmetsp:Transcript_15238/g.47177  ORF Transcript_15238/g.47177 Transcript_15238/m.47177 type:complete len:332 (+) Transcript_15238:197-1192(+)